MPITIPTVSYKEATQIVAAIVKRANEDGGDPIAVAVVNAAARLLCFAAMDGVMQASVRLSQSKAYSAVVGQRDTEHWASRAKHPTLIDFDMRNWTDGNFTGFTGGVVLRSANLVAGGIGVSGRKGSMAPEDRLLQDVELARLGLEAYELSLV
jgi:uncharacterized protein GlcG (DUF336 family)